MEESALVWLRLASPRTRGSTQTTYRVTDVADGFPAHAGIDPRSRVSVSSMVRLPRARGDRPERKAIPLDAAGASPRTRGSTHHRADMFR